MDICICFTKGLENAKSNPEKGHNSSSVFILWHLSVYEKRHSKQYILENSICFMKTPCYFSTVPDYFIWLRYLSWFNYGFEDMMINQWKDYPGTIGKFKTGQK